VDESKEKSELGFTVCENDPILITCGVLAVIDIPELALDHIDKHDGFNSVRLLQLTILLDPRLRFPVIAAEPSNFINNELDTIQLDPFQNFNAWTVESNTR
jgi:hypothetical protein